MRLRAHEGLKLIAFDEAIYLRKLQDEAFEEVSPLYDEPDIFIADELLGGCARYVDSGPIGDDDLPKKEELIVAAIALETPARIRPSHLINDVFAIQKAWVE